MLNVLEVILNILEDKLNIFETDTEYFSGYTVCFETILIFPLASSGVLAPGSAPLRRFRKFSVANVCKVGQKINFQAMSGDSK